MVSTLVRQEQFGEGRVLASGSGRLRISFFGLDGANSEQIFAQDAIAGGVLIPVLLEKGRRSLT
jgi:hypothetical protein